MSDLTYTPPEPNAALVVGPGDALVVSFPAGLQREQVDEIADRIFAKAPGLADRLLVLAGAEQIAVARPPVAFEPCHCGCGRKMPKFATDGAAPPAALASPHLPVAG